MNITIIILLFLFFITLIALSFYMKHAYNSKKIYNTNTINNQDPTKLDNDVSNSLNELIKMT